MLLQKWPLVISAKFSRNHLQLENRLLKQSKCISNKILLKADMLIIIFFHLVAGSALQVLSHRNQLIFSGLKTMHTKCCNPTQNMKHDTGGTRSTVSSSYSISFPYFYFISTGESPAPFPEPPCTAKVLLVCLWISTELKLGPRLCSQGPDFAYLCPSQSATQPGSAERVKHFQTFPFRSPVRTQPSV